MPNKGFCHHCGKLVPEWAYRTARFCSDECRRAHWEAINRPKGSRKAEIKPQGVGTKEVHS